MANKAITQCGRKKGNITVWRCAVFNTVLLLNAVSLAVAGPDGSQVVGGSGSIAHSGNTTTINQTTQNMAIDWQSYNVNANERVQSLRVLFPAACGVK